MGNFSKSEKILLALLGFVQFSHIVDFMIMMPLGPQFMRVFSITPHQFGLLVSVYTFSAGTMGVLASFFTDLFDRKKVLLIFYIGFCISTILCAISTSYNYLLLARILTGAFGGVMSSVTLAIVGDVIAPSKRGSAMGIMMMAFSLASVIGVPFSLYLANHYDWHSPFMFLGLLSLFITAIIYLKIPSVTKHLEHPMKVSPLQNFTNILTEKNHVISLVFMFCLVMGQFTMIPFLSPSLVANAGMKESQLPLIYLIGGALTIFSSPIIGRLSDRIGKKVVFYYGVIISMIPMFIITHLTPSPLYYILPSTALLFVAMGGRMIPAMALITSTVKPENRGSFMNLNSAVQQFSSALASYLAGIIIVKSDSGQLQNYDVVGFIAIGFSFVALYLVNKIKTVE